MENLKAIFNDAHGMLRPDLTRIADAPELQP
jgi:hypothetical protein